MKRGDGWKALSLLLLAALSTACTTAISNVTPPVVSYSREVQAQAASELEAMGPPCPRDTLIEGCSAVHRMIIDFKDTRDQIRAIKN